MRTLDQEIADRLREAAESEELASAKGYGKPLEPDAGWEATPEALRMPMKILKDAGFAPTEIEMFHERARLKALIDVTVESGEREKLRRDLSELEQRLALRLESLRTHGL